MVMEVLPGHPVENSAVPMGVARIGCSQESLSVGLYYCQ